MGNSKSHHIFVIVMRIIAILALVVTLGVKVYANSEKTVDTLLKWSLRANITSAELDYIGSKLSFTSVVRVETQNPLEKVSPSDTSLQSVDSDILASINSAKKARKTTKRKRAGKVIDRTYTTFDGVTTSGLVKVQNRTAKKVDIPATLKKGANLTIADKSKPCVLIYHSHTCESYTTLDEDYWYKGFSPRNTDKTKNMVRVGDAICEQLERAGFNVIHDTTIYDSDYPNAYQTAGKGIDKLLKKYPTIKVAIDIHRDAVDSGKTKYRPITEIQGKRAAQLMIITGCEEDYVKDFPHWRQNLKFALCLQQRCEQLYPSLMRPVYFADRRYNMYKLYNSVLIEMGSDGNTLDQAVYSGKLLGSALANLLEDYVEN